MLFYFIGYDFEVREVVIWKVFRVVLVVVVFLSCGFERFGLDWRWLILFFWVFSTGRIVFGGEVEGFLFRR